ncbi:ATP-binding protein [Paramagnetospirillum kuznetsovii]|nr:ATP-binding protein [Paramagnetospirillum kuznetsovii]
MADQAKALPTKRFFVRMITRDISIEDCILDLLDNALDGASKEVARRHGSLDRENAYDGFWARIKIKDNSFCIEDNCGGIPLAEAKNYAFYFGKPDPDVNGGVPAIQTAEHSIGLYGIGMKRAIFRIGKMAKVVSSTSAGAFEVDIDVSKWEKSGEWAFDLTECKAKTPGTTITLSPLADFVNEEVNSPEFLDKVWKSIARDYSFFIQKGFKVFMGDSEVNPYQFTLREGGGFSPAYLHYTDEETGVRVTIKAGMAGPPPDEGSVDEKMKEVEYCGWYVICNDRIVIAANKNDKTVWTEGGSFPSWHPQYNGFMGLAFFESQDPALLPWTTTKRDIEVHAPVYRRALAKMRDATREWIDYTNQRKGYLEQAKAIERQATSVPIKRISEIKAISVPRFEAKPKVRMANINYSVTLDDLKAVATALGNEHMSYRDVGIETFKFYKENEVD